MLFLTIQILQLKLGMSIYLYLIKESYHILQYGLFEENKDLVSHLNIFRERKTHKKRLPRIAYSMFHKNFEYPSSLKNDEKGEVDKLYIVKPYNGNNLEGLDKIYFEQRSE